MKWGFIFSDTVSQVFIHFQCYDVTSSMHQNMISRGSVYFYLESAIFEILREHFDRLYPRAPGPNGLEIARFVVFR